MKAIVLMRCFVLVWAVLVSVTGAAEINVPGDQATIQDAIDAAVSGADEVVVASGTYSEAIDFLGKAITLRSADGAAMTTIDGNNITTVVTCASGEGFDTILQGFTIRNGNASQGGGMLIDGASPTVIGCIFRDNFSNGDGGAVEHTNSAAATFINCLFFDNESQNQGGAIHTHNSSLALINCTLTENLASGQGGGAILINSGSMTIDNTIVWANSPTFNQIWGAFGGVTVNYSNYQNGWPGSGTNNIQANPQFKNAPGDDFRLQTTSLCIDAGNNNAVPGTITTDLIGVSRFIDVFAKTDTGLGTPPIVDMGAYEAFNDCNGNDIPDDQEPDADGDTIPDDCDVCPGSDDLADADGDGVPDGCDLCPGTGAVPVDVNGCPCVENVTTGVAYSTIQLAIDNALNGHEIVCLPKTYFESIDFLGKAITLRSTNPEDPNVVAATIIHGSDAAQVIQCVSGENLTTILEGFTITAGNADGVGGNGRGGGIYFLTSGASVRHCVFSGNFAFDGGAIYLENGSDVNLTDCTFENNNAGHQGGAISLTGGSNLTATDCTFSNNEILVSPAFNQEYGGAIYGVDGTTTLTRCVFDTNVSSSRGGALYFQTHVTTISHCNFIGNFTSNNSVDRGGAVGFSGGQADLDHSNFTLNATTGEDGSGGALFTLLTKLRVRRCDFHLNNSEIGGAVSFISGSIPYRGLFQHCWFRENQAASLGGALNLDGWADLHNCLIANNTATTFGGGGIFAFRDMLATNCTIVENTTGGNGNGIYLANSSRHRIYNSILWNSNDDLYNAEAVPDPENLELQYCIIGNVPVDSTQEHVSTANPSFVNVALKDYRVTSGSPAIDAGDNGLAYSDDTDLDGHQRFFDDPGTADTGLWDAPIVDIGAYEFGSSPDPCENAIEGDINCDGIVDLFDLALMAGNWLATN